MCVQYLFGICEDLFENMRINCFLWWWDRSGSVHLLQGFIGESFATRAEMKDPNHRQFKGHGKVVARKAVTSYQAQTTYYVIYIYSRILVDRFHVIVMPMQLKYLFCN